VTLQLLLTLLTGGSVACIVVFERDKLGRRIVWSTFIVQGILLYHLSHDPVDCRIFQLAGIADQIAEIYGIYERKSFFRHYDPAMNPEERRLVESSKS
jgi:hypothetical protein